MLGPGLRLAALLLCASRRVPPVAFAQDAPSFKGKTVDIYTGYSVGGGYDLYTRLLARHFGKHLAGDPAVVPKNMEGAASIRLANWLSTAAPKDGSVFGTIGRGTALDPLLGQPGAQFDGTKFNWIGSANDEVSVCVAWHTSGFSTFDDVLRARAADRRHRARRRHHPVRQGPGRRARREAQDHRRLSRRQRCRAGDGARRVAGPLRLVLFEHQGRPSGLARRRRRSRSWCSSRSPSTPSCPTCR